MTAHHARAVLIVDADPEHRHFLKHEYVQAGWHVSEAEEREEAIAHLRANGASVVVIDLDLTRKSRAEFLKQLREVSPGVRIILLASYSVLDRAEGYALGACAVLSKPVDPTVLMERSEKLLEPVISRWKKTPKHSKSDHRIALKVEDLILGRGGFAIPNSAGKSLLEGQSIEFALEIARGKYSLTGHGTVRYVSLDQTRTLQLGWGIEIDDLDGESAEKIESRISTADPDSWIPKH